MIVDSRLKQYFAAKQNEYQYKVVAYGKWSESGRYERVDCSFEFYPPQRQKHNATDRPYKVVSLIHGKGRKKRTPTMSDR